MQISPSAAIERAQNLRQHKIIHELMDKDTTVMFEDPLENDMVLNMGPQHPATHGVLRVLPVSTAKRSSNAFPSSAIFIAATRKLPRI